MPLEPSATLTVTSFDLSGASGSITFERYGKVVVAYGSVLMPNNSNTMGTVISTIDEKFQAMFYPCFYDQQNKNILIGAGLTIRQDGLTHSFNCVYRARYN